MVKLSAINIEMNKPIVSSLAILLSLLSSCVRSSEYSLLKDQYDSLSMLNRSMEQGVYQTDSLVASVLANFQEISHIENMINVNAVKGETPRREQERIRDNMALIRERLDKSSRLVDSLSEQLVEGGRENQYLAGTIAVLRLQIEQQRAYMEVFEQEVNSRITTIGSLDRRIARLRSEAMQIKRDQDLFAELLDTRERLQNQVHYCIGTARDLRDMGITGRDKGIHLEGARWDYLTTSDERQLHKIELHATNARLRTLHPSNSYELKHDAETGQQVLYITDTELFWTFSRVLVVEVE